MSVFLCRKGGKRRTGAGHAFWCKGVKLALTGFSTVKPSQFTLRSCLAVMFTAIGCGVFSYSAQAADPISAYRDSNGRVVFVNEAPSQIIVSKKTGIPDPAATVVVSTAEQPSEQQAPVEWSRISTLPAPGTDAPQEQPGVVTSSWDDMIVRTATRHQVDPDLVRAVVQVESNFNPYAVSSKGAMGLMQLIPSTARRFGVTNAFDPKANLDGGVRYLKYLMDLFGGDLKLSLAAYNAGENAVGRHNGVPPFQETRDYVRKISQLYSLATARRAPAGIEKRVDSKGIVHFSNTDMP